MCVLERNGEIRLSPPWSLPDRRTEAPGLCARTRRLFPHVAFAGASRVLEVWGITATHAQFTPPPGLWRLRLCAAFGRSQFCTASQGPGVRRRLAVTRVGGEDVSLRIGVCLLGSKNKHRLRRTSMGQWASRFRSLR